MRFTVSLCRSTLVAAISLGFIFSMAIAGDDYPGSYYVPGDVNGDGKLKSSDITAMANLFRGKILPADSLPYQQGWLYPAADINGDCRNIGSDLLYIVNVFRGKVPVKYCLDLPPKQVVEIRDDDIGSGDSVYWNSDYTYILRGTVFVESGAILVIEAGALIKGMPGAGENAACLIICRGAKIIAEGSVTRPIIFTSVSDYTDIEGDVSENDTGLWGGLYILGDAPVKSSETSELSDDSTRLAYGGNDSQDNSGILKYISIRHGGIKCAMGESGLYFGGVGSNTSVENVEIYASAGDAVTIKGGTIKPRNLLALHAGGKPFIKSDGYSVMESNWASYKTFNIKDLPRWLESWSYLSHRVALLGN